MKVLLLITRADAVGGAQTHVLAMGKRLLADSKSILVGVGGEGPFTKLLKEHSIPYVTIESLKREISPFNDILALLEIRNLVKTFKPSIISLHSSKAGIIGRLACLSTGIPIVLTVHGWSFTDGVPKLKAIMYKWIERLMALLAKKLIVVSEYDKQLAIKESITNEDKLVKIYNGIEVRNFHQVRKCNDSIVNLIMIARFDKQKDHQTLLYACKGISNIRITLLGDGPTFYKIQQLARELELGDKVFFPGHSNDVSSALEQSDIFLLISNWEGFPISTLEAMNFSLPIIVSDVGGAGEAVIEGRNGFCVPKGNVSFLREKILELVSNKEKRLYMGLESKRILASQFHIEKMYEETLCTFNSLIK